jgi:hypothetical protein
MITGLPFLKKTLPTLPSCSVPIIVLFMMAEENRINGSDRCGLCGTRLAGSPDAVVQGRAYHLCPVCDLLQMAHRNRLDAAEERARYLKHNNSLRTKGYLAFLEHLLQPVMKQLEKYSHAPGTPRGLDFGGGPYPMLAELMSERGYPVEIFDPLFAPRDRARLLDQPFDFILCCETVEHFYQPAEEFGYLKKLLAPKGFLAVKTSLRRAGVDIDGWHYAQDETHVALYSEATMKWIAIHFGLDMSFPAQDVVFFRKPGKKSV